MVIGSALGAGGLSDSSWNLEPRTILIRKYKTKGGIALELG